MKKYFIIALITGAIISFSAASLVASPSITKTEQPAEKEKKDKKKDKKSKADSKAPAKKSCSGGEMKPGCCAGKKAS